MLVKPQLNPPHHHNDKVYTGGRLAAYACCSFSLFSFNGVLKPLLMAASLCYALFSTILLSLMMSMYCVFG